MCDNFKPEPEYIILQSHEENGITIIDKIKFTGVGIVEEVVSND